MDLHRIPISERAPDEVPVVIEVPANSPPVKYEFDKSFGGIVVDRIIPVAMFYPVNYGFIPHSLAGDGDPLDVLVLSEYPIIAGAVIHCRPIGLLQMEDEGGQDEKTVVVPISAVTPLYDRIQEIDDLPELEKQRLVHFFEHYKDLEPNKWVKLSGWGTATQARENIRRALDAA